jgi:DNA-binding MarR family transcriptional regulator
MMIIENATICGTMDTERTPGSLLLVTRLSRLVYRRAGDAMLGMRIKQYGTLCVLRDKEGISQQDMGDLLYMDKNSLVLLLNELEANGWARRRRDPNDRRRHIVELTPEGERAIERGEQAIEDVEDEVLSALSAEERATLQHLLDKALEGAGRTVAAT